MSALCRLCGKKKCVIDLVVELKDESSESNVSIKNIIEHYCRIELDANKLLPQSVCDECKEFIDKIISFCDAIEAVQIKLKNYHSYNLKECFVQLQEIGSSSSSKTKKHQTIEELFDDEINSRSELVLHHLNVPVSEVSVNGKITGTCLKNISPFRWKNVSFKCVGCDETAMKTLTDLTEHIDKVHSNKSETPLHCPLCSFGKFTYVHDYMNHITHIHHEHLKLCCLGCSIMFYDVHSLYNHIQYKHHKIAKLIVPCLCCGMFLENMSSLKAHRQLHLNELNCDGVSVHNEIFTSVLSATSESSFNLKLNERFMNSDGTVKESYKENVKKWCKIKLSCKDCVESGMDPFQLHLHYHQQHPLRKGIKYRCLECECNVDCIYSFLNHYTDKHENHLSYNCVVCSKLYWNFSSLQLHYLECHSVLKVLICLCCGQVFAKASQLLVHVQQKHNLEVKRRSGLRTRDDNIVKQELNLSECDVEEFVGADEDSCDDSEESNQPLIQKPKKTQTRDTTIDTATTIDELFFEEINGTSEIPLNHLNVPLTERLEHGRISKNGLKLISELRWKDIDYNCYTCGSSFDTVMDLKNHVRENHPKSRLMNCSKCKFGEGSKIISYLNHLMTRHHEHLRFCCFVCSAIFYDVSALWKHLTQTHKDIADKILPCLICGQYMETMRLLKIHKVSHVTQENVDSHRAYKRNFATQLDGNVMDSLYNMALSDCYKNADGSVSSNCVTKYSLWSELLLKCRECSVDAMVLPEFHLHCERDHSETIGSKYFCAKCPAESYTRLHTFIHHNISRHDLQLKFCCIICSQMFWNLTALYRHYRACHPNFKIWMCLICGYYSYSFYRLNEHFAKVHGPGKQALKQALTPLQKQLKMEKIKTIHKKAMLKRHAVKTPRALMEQKTKQNRRRTIVPEKLSDNIKTIEELFEPELNGTSSHALIHLNVSKEHVTIDGTVTDVGLMTISPIRWSDIPYRCAECQDSFETVISLRNHVYKRHNTSCNLECFNCPNGKSRMVIGFVNHVTTKHHEHLKFCCIICSIMFYDVQTLWKHVHQAHEMKGEVISPCLICGVIARTLMYAKQHKMTHLNQETLDSHQDFKTFFAKEINGIMMESKYNLAIPDDDKNADGTVKEEACVKWNKWNAITQICQQCPTDPMLLPDYYLHLESNHPELRGQKYTCYECPTVEFHRIEAFLIHNMKRHGTHLSYCCIVCSQLFWNYAAVHRHYRECHPAFKRYICLFCGHPFSDIFKVNEHTTSIHGLKKTADGKVTEMTEVVPYKERARISLKRREKIKSLANDVVLLVNSENDSDVHDTLNVFQNIVMLKQEHVMVEDVEVLDIKDVLIDDILPADIEESFNALDDVNMSKSQESLDALEVKIDKSEDEVTMNKSENDIESIAGDKEWDSFSSDGSDDFKPPAKKKKVFKDRMFKLSKSMKVVKTFEQLFEEEFNGTSNIAQLAHINVREIYKTDNGEMMAEGLEAIDTQRWQNFTFQCLKCDTSYSSVFKLKEHSKKKHPEVKFPLPCPCCPKSSFNDIPSLVNHLSMRHYEHLKFCCLVCSKLFYDIKSLWIHYQHNEEHHKVSNIYPCLCCGTYRVTLKEINLHKTEHMDSQTHTEKYREFYAAEFNGVMAESLFNLILPVEEMNDDGSVTKQCEDRYAKWNSMTTNCTVCKDQFCSAFDLYLHYLNVHPEVKQSFNCTTCVHQNYNSIVRLVSHVHVTHQSHLHYCCIVCSKMFWNFLALHKHYQNCHQSYSTWICLYCGRHSNDVTRVTAHLRFHKNNVMINGEKKYRCNNCSKIFEHLESYNAHGCPKEKMREAPRKTSKNVSHICEVCGVGFPGPRALENHMLCHSEESKGSNLAECTVCHAKLKNKWTLKQHMVKHSKVKPFKCDICDVSFHHKSTKDRHMMVHTGERPHACLHCDKKFAAKFDLTIHTRLHTGEMNYACTMCDDRYPSWSNLYKHAKSKHNLDIRSDTHKKNSMLLKSDYDSE